MEFKKHVVWIIVNGAGGSNAEKIIKKPLPENTLSSSKIISKQLKGCV